MNHNPYLLPDILSIYSLDDAETTQKIEAIAARVVNFLNGAHYNTEVYLNLCSSISGSAISLNIKHRQKKNPTFTNSSRVALFHSSILFVFLFLGVKPAVYKI